MPYRDFPLSLHSTMSSDESSQCVEGFVEVRLDGQCQIWGRGRAGTNSQLNYADRLVNSTESITWEGPKARRRRRISSLGATVLYADRITGALL